ncbi:murein biosynthesis integral membrane protein MurJ [Catelliglobosispora koreensis]|uniref:murein biosynthesis integral membrane protein MurJ n=1 Tax=Catelliglobosispora koreensis TaxID=129052 RepID=UPI0003602E77|nr:murein biosynthesis integral membrane protein MurJ [Catelliglobosispora koreensis]
MNPPEHRPRHSAEHLTEPTALLPVVEATEPASVPVPVPESDPEPEGSGAARNSAIMAVGSLVSRGTGFIRTAVMAMALGGSLVGNAYTTAQFFPGMIYELLVGGIMSSVLVPMLVKARKKDADKGESYTQRLLTLSFIVLGITTLLAVICAPLLAFAYASEASDASKHVITMLSYLMLPTIFFYGLSGLCGAILNARHSFAAPMWTPILNNIVVIATGIFYMVTFGTGQIDPEDMTPGRILVLGGGFLLGILTQAFGLLPALRKTGFRFKWRTDFRQLGLRELGTVGGWMFCYVIVNQLALIMLVNLLNRGGDGDAGPMIYNNVFLLLMMAHGIVAVSVITALLPRMSAAAIDGRAGEIANDLSQGIRMVTVLLAPIAVIYTVLALPISVALFQGFAFTPENSEASQNVLMVAGLTLVPMSVSQLFNFTYYSLQDTKTPALINLPVVALRLSVQLAWFATFAISATAMGMMVGNGVSFVLAALLSGMLLRRRIGRIGLKSITTTGIKVLVASLAAAAAGIGAMKLLTPDGTLGKGMAFVLVIVGGAVIGGVYLIVARLLRTREIEDVFGLIRRKIGR